MYADALGDERGEHIVLANLAAPSVEQKRRERELRRAADQAMATAKLARLTWRRGFVERIDLDLRGENALDRLRGLLARPELVRLRAIGLCEREHVETVRAFVDPRVCFDEVITYVDDLVIPPDLERLVIANVPAPAIGSIIERCEGLPLRQLGLVGGDDAFNDAFVERLAASPRLLARLSSVGFTAGRYDGSNRWLLANPAAYAHARFFTAPHYPFGSAAAWHDLAHLYEALGRTDEALAEFDALVTFDDDAMYHADIGMQLAKLERREEALAAHDHAIALDATNQRAWSGRACLLEDAERFTDALAAWDAGQAAGLADVHTWTHRAWVLMQLDRNNEAIVAIDAALALDPKHDWSLDNRKKLTSLVGKATRGIKRIFRRA